MSLPVIAIFDIGKTNQKLFLFDEGYRVVFEKSVHLPEINDEDGFPCEDVEALSEWVTGSLSELLGKRDFEIKAVNVSAHGASFVNIGESGKPVTPLYNYLKPFSEELKKKFYDTYGGEKFAAQTASPILGNLNSGMQLYRLKYERPDAFSRVKYALHLPEYISFLITGKVASGITSIGCHTNLWDFSTRNYHPWVQQEGILEKLAPIFPSHETSACNFRGHHLLSGIGLHDSSAALIPYLKTFQQPFVLLSTGTWNISLNPFNTTALTAGELANDCLCYLTFDGNPVKASRLFAGHDHDEQVSAISKKFGRPAESYRSVKHNPDLVGDGVPVSFEEAYHQLVVNLVARQRDALLRVLSNADVNTIFVDGGFCNNAVFMKLLSEAFPSKEVWGAELHQASALGAALVLHSHWNKMSLPRQPIILKRA